MTHTRLPGPARMLLPLAVLLATAATAVAGARSLPVPSQVIYPGDRISDAMLTDSTDAGPAIATEILWERRDIVGRVARRTLLPGRPIPAIAVEEPRAVSTGALVQIVYQQDGISIVTKAQALQNGFVGQIVQVRNVDSGQVISGLVLPDGSIRVDGG